MIYKPFEYEGKMHYPALPVVKDVPCSGCAYRRILCTQLRAASSKACNDGGNGCTGVIWQTGEQARINCITRRLTT